MIQKTDLELNISDPTKIDEIQQNPMKEHNIGGDLVSSPHYSCSRISLGKVINDGKLSMKIGKETLANYSSSGGDFGTWTHLLRACKTRNNYPDNWNNPCLHYAIVRSSSLELDYNYWILALANMGCVSTL